MNRPSYVQNYSCNYCFTCKIWKTGAVVVGCCEWVLGRGQKSILVSATLSARSWHALWFTHLRNSQSLNFFFLLYVRDRMREKKTREQKEGKRRKTERNIEQRERKEINKENQLYRRIMWIMFAVTPVNEQTLEATEVWFRRQYFNYRKSGEGSFSMNLCIAGNWKRTHLINFSLDVIKMYIILHEI